MSLLGIYNCRSSYHIPHCRVPETPLRIAAMHDDKICVHHFLKTDEAAGLNDSGRSALMSAAHYGHVDLVAELLPLIDPNLQDITGRTALMSAAQEGHFNVVRVFLAYRLTNLNLQNYDGRTALMIADKAGYTEIVKLLKKNGATE